MSARRRHLSGAQWRDVLGRFDSQAESVGEFCAREGVCASSFYRWRTRMAGKSPEPRRAGQPPLAASLAPHRAAGFVDLGPLMPPASPQDGPAPAGLLLRVDLGGGMVLQISRP